MSDAATAAMSRKTLRPGTASRRLNAVEAIEESDWASGIPAGLLDLKKCTVTWAMCMRQISRWRVPPRWLMVDWFEEIQSESMVAVMEALFDYDPDSGVPLQNFIGMRIRSRALSRYRREWSYSLHQVIDKVLEKGDGGSLSVELALKIDLRWGLRRLAPIDRFILERLFWEGETESEVAWTLQVSQQWVNKRKNASLAKLQRLLNK